MCGSIEDAWYLFDKMPERNVVSWTTMIAAYVQQGKSERALSLFCEMQQTGTKIDAFILGNMLRACTSLVAQEQGKQIHAHIITTGFDCNVSISNSLVSMYAKCGSIDEAQQVFDKIHERNMVSWTTVIAGYVQCGHSEETLKLFRQMQVEGMEPDHFIFATVLGVAAGLTTLEHGKQIHVVELSLNSTFPLGIPLSLCISDVGI
jgi:pentatricopeptide repeat protein